MNLLSSLYEDFITVPAFVYSHREPFFHDGIYLQRGQRKKIPPAGRLPGSEPLLAPTGEDEIVGR